MTGKTSRCLLDCQVHCARMSNYIIIGFVLLLFPACSLKVESSSQQDRSDADRFLEYDFGVVERDVSVSGEIEIRNTGASAIAFNGSDTGCGCLQIVSMPESVAPGEVGIVKLNLDTHGRSGEVQVNARLLGSSGSKADFFIKATALVESSWAIPSSINLGTMSTRTPVEKELAIVSAGSPTADIISAESNVDWMSVSFERIKGKRSADSLNTLGRCRIVVDGTMLPVGVVNGTITVKVSANTNACLFIDVRGEFADRVVITPRKVFFGLVDDTEVSRECRLTFVDTLAKAEVSVVADHEWLTVDVVDHPMDGSMRVTAKAMIRDSIPSGLFEGYIKGHKRDGSELFRIPYTGIIAD